MQIGDSAKFKIYLFTCSNLPLQALPLLLPLVCLSGRSETLWTHDCPPVVTNSKVSPPSPCTCILEYNWLVCKNFCRKHLIIGTFIQISPYRKNRLDVYKQYKILLPAYFPHPVVLCHLVATLSYYKLLSWQLYPGQRKVMAATMETSAGTNMLQFLKLIGQLKVRNLNRLLQQRKEIDLKNIYNVLIWCFVFLLSKSIFSVKCKLWMRFSSLFVVFDITYRGSPGLAGFTGMWRILRVCQITCTAWQWCLWPSPIRQWTRTGASLAHSHLWSTSVREFSHSHSYEQFSRPYTNFIMRRCIKLALVHDMAECIVGDITPSDNISKAEKHRREEASAATTTPWPRGTIMF